MWNPYEQHHLEPELAVSPPRPVRLTREARALRACVLLALVAVPGVLLGAEAWNAGRRSQFRQAGRTVEGRVLAKRPAESRATGFYVDYAFEVDGRSHRGTRYVYRAEYDRVNVGEPAVITYLPSDPEVFRVGAEDVSSARLDLARAAGVAMALALAAGSVIRRQRRQLVLARTGHPVAGTVTKASRRRWSPVAIVHAEAWTVTYAFESADRSRRQGTTRVPASPFDDVCPGDPVTVLQDPLEPARHDLYRALTTVEVGPPAPRRAQAS